MKFWAVKLYLKEQGFQLKMLFDHLKTGITIDAFLDDFPSVTKVQAIALLEYANKLLNTKNLDQLYAAAT